MDRMLSSTGGHVAIRTLGAGILWFTLRSDRGFAVHRVAVVTAHAGAGSLWSWLHPAFMGQGSVSAHPNGDIKRSEQEREK